MKLAFICKVTFQDITVSEQLHKTNLFFVLKCLHSGLKKLHTYYNCKNWTPNVFVIYIITINWAVLFNCFKSKAFLDSCISSYWTTYCIVQCSAVQVFGLSGPLLTNVEPTPIVCNIKQRKRHTYSTQASLQKPGEYPRCDSFISRNTRTINFYLDPCLKEGP